MPNRYLRNLFTTRWVLRRCFPPRVLRSIEQAVAQSETRHSGELRFAIETALDVPSLLRGVTARERAIDAFALLRIWDTAASNGVLIYLLLAEHDIEIVADRGFSGKISTGQWRQVCAEMREAFRRGDFEQGALRGIERAGELISLHYPPDPGGLNELPNRPVLL
jgi:uncharacterized membrane protein